MYDPSPQRWRLPSVFRTDHASTRCPKATLAVSGLCFGCYLDPRTLQRAEGYRACLRDAGCYDPRLELMSREPSSITLGAQMFEDLLKIHPDVDGVFFCNDDLAQGGLLCAQRLGVSIPKQLSVAGFNDLSGSDQMIPPLTTVSTPRAEVGYRGAQMLLELMKGREPEIRAVHLGFELVVRGSS
jgi:LacI family gluconate utilization system Gnt-I transcriptional repressor